MFRLVNLSSPVRLCCKAGTYFEICAYGVAAQGELQGDLAFTFAEKSPPPRRPFDSEQFLKSERDTINS
jgi:hypothetical protein